MSRSSARALEEALALSEDDRGKLAEQLVQSLDGEPEPDAERVWAAEIEARLARHDAGTAKLLSMDDALERLHRAALGR